MAVGCTSGFVTILQQNMQQTCTKALGEEKIRLKKSQRDIKRLVLQKQCISHNCCSLGCKDFFCLFMDTVLYKLVLISIKHNSLRTHFESLCLFIKYAYTANVDISCFHKKRLKKTALSVCQNLEMKGLLKMRGRPTLRNRLN